MKAVADDRGVIAAAAMDQRGSLQKALAKEKGGAIGDREIEEFDRWYEEMRRNEPESPFRRRLRERGILA